MKMLAKLAFWAVLIFLVAIAAAVLLVPYSAYAQEQKQEEKQEDAKPLLKWLVIYEDRGWNNQGPHIEIRMIIEGASEGDAVASSMRALMDKFGSQNCGHFKFKEVAQKKAEK